MLDSPAVTFYYIAINKIDTSADDSLLINLLQQFKLVTKNINMYNSYYTFTVKPLEINKLIINITNVLSAVSLITVNIISTVLT